MFFSNYESLIPKVFDRLIKDREHISIVTDEYGTVTGIVTMEDIIETLTYSSKSIKYLVTFKCIC